MTNDFNFLSSSMKNPVRRFVLVIFGVTGHLAQTKIIPALFRLYWKNIISQFLIIGTARRDWNQQIIQDKVYDLLHDFPSAEQTKRKFVQKFVYIQSDSQDESVYHKIKIRYTQYDRIIFYLAVSPQLSVDIIYHLGKLKKEESKKKYSIVVEKPFGFDNSSAQQYNQKLLSSFSEEEIFRIDHYLGKEIIQNILYFRHFNPIFSSIWDYKHIDYVEILASESDGIGTRGAFFDNTGIVRDMIQSHLLQILSLICLDFPHNFNQSSLMQAKKTVIENIIPYAMENIDSHFIKAQYVKNHPQEKSYIELEGVKSDSITETYAAIKLYLSMPRWKGVPFYLRVGKALKNKHTRIIIHFKSRLADKYKNALHFIAYPHEGLSLDLIGKQPGVSHSVMSLDMPFIYEEKKWLEYISDYELLLLACFLEEKSLFLDQNFIEHSWKFIDRLFELSQVKKMPLYYYFRGSQGPYEVESILDPGHHWFVL